MLINWPVIAPAKTPMLLTLSGIIRMHPEACASGLASLETCLLGMVFGLAKPCLLLCHFQFELVTNK